MHTKRLSVYLRSHVKLSLHGHSIGNSSRAGEIGSNAPSTREILKPPKMPDASECCGNGCNDCVWLTYFEEYAAYTETKKSQDAAKTGKDKVPDAS